MGIKEQLITGYYHPYIYLAQNMIAKHKLTLDDVQNKVANALLSVEDVYQAVASNKVASLRLADTLLNRANVKNYSPSRSGDIDLIFKPQ